MTATLSTRATGVVSAGLIHSADPASLSTADLLALCDRLYRRLDSDFPSGDIRAGYDQAAAELHAREETRNASTPGGTVAGHPE
ncbi:hypothetical protein IV498_15895 [Paenarthrobacter sp. Z7-10]|uniref:hypothetical protein n=1 Tax=Paenarthrobacter sp. Z7-10 TaxID=2787635 RepID=UPI0022A9ADE7|nr:hypothetical protein [Paenarthrobacter sp. Z7-10]MCZ2404620.1 hypothetical protein [Paenarthrobacter sp. Z7-10]